MRHAFGTLCLAAVASAQATHTHSQQYQHADPWEVNRKEIEYVNRLVDRLDEKCQAQEIQIDIMDTQVLTLKAFLDPITTQNTSNTTEIGDSMSSAKLI